MFVNTPSRALLVSWGVRPPSMESCPSSFATKQRPAAPPPDMIHAIRNPGHAPGHAPEHAGDTSLHVNMTTHIRQFNALSSPAPYIWCCSAVAWCDLECVILVDSRYGCSVCSPGRSAEHVYCAVYCMSWWSQWRTLSEVMGWWWPG